MIATQIGGIMSIEGGKRKPLKGKFEEGTIPREGRVAVNMAMQG